MTVFVDTSLLYAYLDADDAHHEAVLQAWRAAIQRRDDIVTSNYVVTETLALCQHRLGFKAVRHLLMGVVPALWIHWVDQPVHDQAASAVLTAGRRGLSLVDCVSFEVMRRRGIRQALTLDRHFAEQGFECLP